jgi:hypothetical protein
MRSKQLLALLLIFVSALTYAQQPATRLITGIVKDEMEISFRVLQSLKIQQPIL